MSEFTVDLSEGQYDFSNDSLVKESLLKGLLARQASRKAVSFEELDDSEWKRGRKSFTREPGAPAKEKGRGL